MWYADARGHSTSGQTWTSLNHLKNVLSCVNRSYHLPFRLQRNIRKRTSITQCMVNLRKYTSKRNPSIGKTPLLFFNSSTCIAVEKSIHKMHVTIFQLATPCKQLTVTQAQLTLHSSLKDISTVAWRISCAGCSIWNRKKPQLFSGHYLRNRSTLDIGVLGYIGIL